jgi:hypothetical protein
MTYEQLQLEKNKYDDFWMDTHDTINLRHALILLSFLLFFCRVVYAY